MAGQGCGEARAEEAVVGSGEEQSSAETGIGDVVVVGVWQALDHAVEVQAAQLIGPSARTEGFRRATAEFGEMAAQVGSAKAVWKTAEEDQGMP